MPTPFSHEPTEYHCPFCLTVGGQDAEGDGVLAAVQIAGKRIALALRTAYGCEGTSFRQHNEPAGGQEVWHYHLHVFPRYLGDDLYGRNRERRLTTPMEREPYAQKLRKHLGQQ